MIKLWEWEFPSQVCARVVQWRLCPFHTDSHLCRWGGKFLISERVPMQSLLLPFHKAPWEHFLWAWLSFPWSVELRGWSRGAEWESSPCALSFSLLLSLAAEWPRDSPLQSLPWVTSDSFPFPVVGKCFQSRNICSGILWLLKHMGQTNVNYFV